MPLAKRNILWLDCLGGLSVGAILLVLQQQIARWDGLPSHLVLVLAVANLTYGSFSLLVTLRRQRSANLVPVLAIANMLWFFVCGAIVAYYWPDISLFGIAHVLGEGVYVGCLGYTEWQWRRTLVES